jgi:hypothetical protein
VHRAESFRARKTRHLQSKLVCDWQFCVNHQSK